MPRHSLTKKDEAYLTIEIDGKEYSIPLARSLKVKEVRKLLRVTKLEDVDQYDFMVDFLGRYLGADVVDEMTSGDLMEVVKLWHAANAEVEDITLGES